MIVRRRWLPAFGTLHTRSTSIISESIKMSIDTINFNHILPILWSFSGKEAAKAMRSAAISRLCPLDFGLVAIA